MTQNLVYMPSVQTSINKRILSSIKNANTIKHVDRKKSIFVTELCMFPLVYSCYI